MFSSNSFSRASFSTNAFKMVEEANSGRSGYWRLFFYNMQEEALKNEQVKGKETPQREIERATQTTPVVATPAKRRPAIREPDEEIVEAPPVRLKPLYHRASTPENDEVTWLLNITSLEFRGIILHQEPIRLALLAREAANSEKLKQDEDDVELLLLLAA